MQIRGNVPAGNEFVELKELGLPDRVLAIGWCGDSICLGFHKECASVLHNPHQAWSVGISMIYYCLSAPKNLHLLEVCRRTGRALTISEQLKVWPGCAGTTWCM